MGISEQFMLVVASLVKGITINIKKPLDHALLRSPETCILQQHGYNQD